MNASGSSKVENFFFMLTAWALSLVVAFICGGTYNRLVIEVPVYQKQLLSPPNLNQF